MESRPVFYDPRGRRGPLVTRVGAVLATVVAVLTTLTAIVALFTIPYLPREKPSMKATSLPGMPAKDLKRASFLTAQQEVFNNPGPTIPAVNEPIPEQ